MLAKLLIGFIRFYQRGVSPFTPPTCRYTPTCSQYALEAVEAHGPGRGSWLALRRLLRCHPFGGKGYDPVPGAQAGRVSGSGRGELAMDGAETSSAAMGKRGVAER